LVVTMVEVLVYRWAMTWNRAEAPSAGSGRYPSSCLKSPAVVGWTNERCVSGEDSSTLARRQVARVRDLRSGQQVMDRRRGCTGAVDRCPQQRFRWEQNPRPLIPRRSSPRRASLPMGPVHRRTPERLTSEGSGDLRTEPAAEPLTAKVATPTFRHVPARRASRRKGGGVPRRWPSRARPFEPPSSAYLNRRGVAPRGGGRVWTTEGAARPALSRRNHLVPETGRSGGCDCAWLGLGC